MRSGQPVNRTLASIMLVGYVVFFALVTVREARARQRSMTKKRTASNHMTRLLQR